MPLLQDIQIVVKEITSSVSPIHRHPYFELLYILDGNGTHTINYNSYPYQAGALYLLTPEDTHTFQTENKTLCCIIDFTKELFAKRYRKQNDRADIGEFFIQLEYIFHHHYQLKGKIELAEKEVSLTRQLIEQLLAEKKHNRILSGILIQNIVFLLLNLIARYISESATAGTPGRRKENLTHKISVYIQQHIYNQEKLKLENIADHFHKTADHLNRLFKKETGITLKAYINRYKVNLVETRLRYSDLSISEIADELHFSDESHLNKVFKNVHGLTTTAYRRQVNASQTQEVNG